MCAGHALPRAGREPDRARRPAASAWGSSRTSTPNAPATAGRRHRSKRGCATAACMVFAADDKGGVAAMAVAATLLHAQGRPAPIVMSLHGKGGGQPRQPADVRAPEGLLAGALRASRRNRARLRRHQAHRARRARHAPHGHRAARDRSRAGQPRQRLFSEGGDALQAALAIVDDQMRGGTLKGCEVNVGELSAGDRVGSVPASARARIRVLFDDARSFGDILAAARRDAERVAAARGKGNQRITITLEARWTRRQLRRGAVGPIRLPGAAHIDRGRHGHGAGVVSHALRGRHPLPDPPSPACRRSAWARWRVDSTAPTSGWTSTTSCVSWPS